jgi:L-threonylcarbamoyladenylate synthase
LVSPDLSVAAEAIRSGGVVAYPTEAVFGLGCDPMNKAAVDKLLGLKQRPREKGLIVLAWAFAQLAPYIEPQDDAVMQRVMSTWPGPTTWLLPASEHAPDWLRGHFDTLAVRVTAHPLAAALCRKVGFAIVSTSANLAGRPPARSADAVRQAFAGSIDYVLDGAVGDLERPTEIRDALSGEIIRAG